MQADKRIMFCSFVLISCLLVCNPGFLLGEMPKNISLPSPRISGGKPVMQALKERKSQREYSSKEIPVEVLSDLLWAACGVNRPESRMRTNPTAKNYQEIEVYVARKDGLYKYEPLAHEMSFVSREDVRALTGKQDFVIQAPVNLVFVADFSKMANASTNEKEALANLDTGFVSENVYLYCASEGLATVVRGWFDALPLAQAMKLGSDKKVILCQSVGYPKE